MQDGVATRTALLTHLKLEKLEEALKEETKAVLNGYETERASDAIFDAGYVFKPEVVQEAYSTAFDAVLGRVESCYGEDTLQIVLNYDIKGWKIAPDASLLDAICGK